MELVKFVYKDGFVKRCSRKEAEVLAMMGRGAIEEVVKPKPVKPAAEVFKPVAPPVEEKAAETPVVEEKPVSAPVESPVKRRGRPSKA